MSLELQLELERKYSSKHTVTILKEIFEDEFMSQTAIKVRDKLNQLDSIPAIDIEECLSTLVYKLYASRKSQTIQAMIGYVVNDITTGDTDEQMKMAVAIIHVLLWALTTTPFVSGYPTSSGYVFKGVTLPDEFNDKLASNGHTLPSVVKPLKLYHNREIGYRSFKGSVFVGHALSANDFPMPLAAINRLNGQAMRVEPRVFDHSTPLLSDAPRYSKRLSRDEEPQEALSRFNNEVLKADTTPELIMQMMNAGNKFYMHHLMDSRGRINLSAYHFNYQQDKHVRAWLQFSKKELVEGEW
jgi:hypothetical protein